MPRRRPVRPTAEVATNRPLIDRDCSLTKAGPRGEKGDTGATGARGPQGPPGKDGADGKSITPEEVAAIIVQVLEADPDRFRGPKGDQGPAGSAANVDLDAIAKQVRAGLQLDVVYPNLDGTSEQQATIDFSKGRPTLYLPDTTVTIRNLDARLRLLEQESKDENGRQTTGTR